MQVTWVQLSPWLGHHNGGALCYNEDLRQPKINKINKNKARQYLRRKAFRSGRWWVPSGVILCTRCSASHNLVCSYFCSKGKSLQVARSWAKGAQPGGAHLGRRAWGLLGPPVPFALLRTEEGWKTNSSGAPPALDGSASCLPHIYLGFLSCVSFSSSGSHPTSGVTLT